MALATFNSGIGNGTRIITSVEEAAAAVIKPGDDVVLQCSAEGSGELQYDWFHNGRKIPKSGRSKKVLNLNSVGPAESGTYSCSARNGAGPTRFNAPFVLSVGPRRLVRFNKDVVAAPDSAVRLPCAFDPPVTVEWLFRSSKSK